MIKSRNLVLLFIFIFLSHCGYTTVYKNQQTRNLKIVIETLNGNKNFNKILYSKLKELKNTDSKNIYYLTIDSNLDKKIIAKDSRGKTTDYEMSVKVSFEIKKEQVYENISYNESFKLSSNDNSFEQKRYENNILDNFASSIKEKLIFKLNTLND